MQQEVNQNDIQVYFLDGHKITYPKDFNEIKKALIKKENVKWMLFDYDSGNLIHQDNIKQSDNLKAFRAPEIAQSFRNTQSISDLIKDRDWWKQKCTDQEQQLNDSHRIKQEYLPQKVIEEIDLKKLCQTLNKQIQELKEKLEQQENQCTDEKSYSYKMINKNIGLSDQIAEISIENNQLTQQNKIMDGTIKQLTEQYSSQDKYSKQLSQELQEKEQVIKENSIKLESLQKVVEEQSQEIILFKNQSNNLQKPSDQQNQLIQETTFSSYNSTRQIAQSKLQIRNVENQDLYLEQDQRQQFESDFALHVFETLKPEQEDQQQNENQIKFFQSILKKYQEDIKDARQINKGKNICIEQTSLQRVEIYQITLDETLFKRNIKEQNFFFRDTCIKKNPINHENNKIQQSMAIIINAQQIIIKKVQALSKSQLEAKDLSLNILIVYGYLKIFVSHLEQINMKSDWNLKIPRQFLVKDDQDNYYVYQESFQVQTNNFVAFETFQKADQFMSSFFKYFYYATNKNFALTECEFGEQQKNIQEREIIIVSIIIHSNFSQMYSILDKGKSEIEKFESLSSKERKLMYWSIDLQNLAKTLWNDNLK